jgi:bifunctional DNase/RNase/DNA-directed RNA polymerase specialized sigma24 family protein
VTDAALVTAAREGDRDAFATLAERHRPALLRACRGSADAAQDALLIAMTRLQSLRDDDAFGAWLCGIGRNVTRGQTPPVTVPPVEEAVWDDRDPLLRERVLTAIAALPAGQRDAVALFYLADLSHAEIAARLGTSVGAVKTRLHKARAALQARLADLRREPPTMPSVAMRVTDVVAADPLHILLLEETGGARRLPIWIPPAEGERIAARLRAEDRPRPDTYRFTADLLAAAGASLAEVRIVRLAETIFYAEAVLQDGTAVDARPSDAVNLALVTGAPVLVDEGVLAAAAENEAGTAAELEAALRARGGA